MPFVTDQKSWSDHKRTKDSLYFHDQLRFRKRGAAGARSSHASLAHKTNSKPTRRQTSISIIMFLSFRLFVLAITTPVVFSQSTIDNDNIKGLVKDWCNGNTATVISTIIQNHGEIQDWNVTGVTDMSRLFESASVDPSCNADIAAWDVSNVVDMQRMVRSLVCLFLRKQRE